MERLDGKEATLSRLEDQIGWYDRRSIDAQWWHKRLKIAAIIAAALVPLTAGFSICPWITGLLGVFIAVIEGIQQLNQYQHNWITYRSTCEALKHEKYLYLATAGPYANVPNPDMLLAERIESLISQEHAKWASTQQNAQKKPAEGQSVTE